MGATFITAAVACSIGLAHLLKTIEHKRLSRIRVLTINYLVAAITAIIHSLVASHPFQFNLIPPELWVTAVWLGAMFIITFFIFSKSIDANGMGISVAAMRISLVLPVTAGILFFNERSGLLKLSGILLIIFSLLLLIPFRKNGKTQFNTNSVLLLLIFVITGTNDILLKYFEHHFNMLISETWFSAILFSVAFLCGMGYIIFKNQLRFTRHETGYGVLIGVINLYSTVFLLYALRYLEASVVFPVINVSVVTGGTLLGIYMWKDHLTTNQWLGLLLACTGLILLF